MIKFIGENIVFPKSAKKKGITGTVYVNFIVSNKIFIDWYELKKNDIISY